MNSFLRLIPIFFLFLVGCDLDNDHAGIMITGNTVAQGDTITTHSLRPVPKDYLNKALESIHTTTPYTSFDDLSIKYGNAYFTGWNFNRFQIQGQTNNHGSTSAKMVENPVWASILDGVFAIGNEGGFEIALMPYVGQNNLSIELQFNPTQPQPGHIILNWTNSMRLQWGDSNQILLYINQNNQFIRIAKAKLPIKSWSYVTLRIAEGRAQIFVNDTLRDDQKAPQWTAPNKPLTIGGLWNPTSHKIDSSFEGLIDFLIIRPSPPLQRCIAFIDSLTGQSGLYECASARPLLSLRNLLYGQAQYSIFYTQDLLEKIRGVSQQKWIIGEQTDSLWFKTAFASEPIQPFFDLCDLPQVVYPLGLDTNQSETNLKILNASGQIIAWQNFEKKDSQRISQRGCLLSDSDTLLLTSREADGDFPVLSLIYKQNLKSAHFFMNGPTFSQFNPTPN